MDECRESQDGGSGLADAVQSTTVVLDDTGTALAQQEYEPFGDDWASWSASEPAPRKFNAQEYDAASGLYYFNARHQAPMLARFRRPRMD